MSRAYELSALKRAGINVSELGCVMLDVEIPDLTEAIPPQWGHTSSDPAHWWITGIQATGHVTLLYGLLPGLVDRAGVDEVLDRWEPPKDLEASGYEIFPSPFPDDPYDCVVARVDHPALRDAHSRLSLLPHINTHPEYKAHVTLAYVQQGKGKRTVGGLEQFLSRRFPPAGLNYGHQIEEA